MKVHEATEQAYKNGYAKGVKEFAERLKEKAIEKRFVCSRAFVRTEYTITEESFDNLAKEMVGADNG